jgi:hypothetical protein
MGALLNGCREIGPYALRGGLNLGACRLVPTVIGAETMRAASGCGMRDENETLDGSIPRNL